MVLDGKAVIFETKGTFTWLSGVYKTDDIDQNDFHYSSPKLSNFYYRVFHKGDFKVLYMLDSWKMLHTG